MSTAVKIDVETRLAVNDLLVAEAAMLDSGRFEDWLALFTDDIQYVAPIRVIQKSGLPDVVDETGWFDDNRASLELRVHRLETGVAWAEDPRSMTRRFVTNLRIAPDGDNEFVVVSNLLLYRSRHDEGNYELISCERTDRLRLVDGELKISHRRILIDQGSLSAKNLAVFL